MLNDRFIEVSVEGSKMLVATRLIQLVEECEEGCVIILDNLDDLDCQTDYNVVRNLLHQYNNVAWLPNK